MNKENTAKRLKQILKQKNLKQIDVLNLSKEYCEKYNVKLNKSDLSQYISGKVVPSHDKLIILSMVLGVTEAWLMGFDVPMEDSSVFDLSNPDTILFEITPRSLINSPKIASSITESIEKNFKDVITDGVTIYDLLHCSQSYREKANILNSVIDYVLYNPITNNVDIVFLSVGQDTPERHADMMICPVELQPIVLQLESLNALGKAKIFENIKDLAYINKYKKYDKLGEGDE